MPKSALGVGNVMTNAIVISQSPVGKNNEVPNRISSGNERSEESQRF